MRHRWAALPAVAILLALPVSAQIDTGIISGKVVDPSGAVVPGAEITVTQVETNIQSKGQSNEDGKFRVPSLKIGGIQTERHRSRIQRPVAGGHPPPHRREPGRGPAARSRRRD